MSESLDGSVNRSNARCFHCGLPVASGEDCSSRVDGVLRRFCCAGCRAVCETIVGAGLGEYYRHRQTDASPNATVTPAFLQQLAIYDRPEIQAGFVRGTRQARETALIIEDVRCPACLWLNERHLRGIEGVLDAELDYTTERAWVRWDPERISLSRILAAITDIGYIAYPYDPTHREHLEQTRKRRSTERLIFAGLVMMPLVQFSIASYLMGQPGPTGELPLWVTLGRWTGLLAAAALLLYPAQEFFVGAWRDLSHRRLGMDVPIVTGLAVAFLGSAAATLTQGHEVYFDSIAMFVFFVLLARRLELNGRLLGAGALDRLNRVVPRTAERVDARGATQTVAIVDLARGDRIRLRPGEVLAADAVVMQGTSRVDEAVLTGESSPRSRTPGDRVAAGTRNLDATLLLEVVRASGESTLDRIQQRLRQALRSPTHHALLADRAARWFVHILLVVAVLTAGFWLWRDPAAALANTVAVLIVTCPCALALAAPVAMSVSIARLTARGILPLRAEALERLGGATVVAFDKTGTLTTGDMRLDHIRLLGAADRQAVLRLAAALEGDSEHPIARVFRTLSDNAGVAVTGRRQVPGGGVSARVDGRLWRLGSPEFVLDQQTPAPELGAQIDALATGGQTVIALGEDGRIEALFALSQTLREGTRELIDTLRQQGIEHIAVLSGDRQSAVDWLAGQLPLDTALGGMSPEQKTAWVGARQQAGQRVVMLGDGINDAATLAEADASISFAQAAELAQSGSGVLLMQDDIAAVQEAFRVARMLRRVTLQNLIWAGSYNLLAVPAAAAGWVPPWAAALGMSISSLIVVGNSLRLRGRTPRQTSATRQDVHSMPPGAPVAPV